MANLRYPHTPMLITQIFDIEGKLPAVSSPDVDHRYRSFDLRRRGSRYCGNFDIEVQRFDKFNIDCLLANIDLGET